MAHRKSKIQLASAEFASHFDKFLRRFLVKYRPLICPFEELLSIVPSNVDILDIGCGNGLWLYLLQRFKSPYRVVGVDSNDLAIKAARKVFSRTHQPITFITASDPIAWPEETFDIVTLIDVLHHIPSESQQQFFHHVTLKVKPGGSLLYKDMCKRPAWRAFCNQLHDLMLARQWVNHLEVHFVENWAADSGLILDFAMDRSMYWYGHEIRRFVRPLE